MRCIPAFSVYIHNCSTFQNLSPSSATNQNNRILSLHPALTLSDLFFINIPSLSISYLTITHELFKCWTFWIILLPVCEAASRCWFYIGGRPSLRHWPSCWGGGGLTALAWTWSCLQNLILFVKLYNFVCHIKIQYHVKMVVFPACKIKQRIFLGLKWHFFDHHGGIRELIWNKVIWKKKREAFFFDNKRKD